MLVSLGNKIMELRNSQYFKNSRPPVHINMWEMNHAENNAHIYVLLSDVWYIAQQIRVDNLYSYSSDKKLHIT